MGRNNLRESSQVLSASSFGNGHDFGRQRSMPGDFAYEQNIMSVSITGKGNGKQRVIPDEDYKLLQSYFKEVGTESLLTATDELRIATKIKKYNARARKLEAMIGKLADGSLGVKTQKVCECRRTGKKAGAVSKAPQAPRPTLKATLNRMSALLRAYRNK
ncbi:MAG TPA: sigma-70 factor domain-containing protein, partial [Thermodesulfobacteriota bacterium]|nr:sigma-70 factor domain-containing protein [Thermodesulfobacteriota bacterium]